MTEILALTAAVVAVVLIAGATIRAVVADGYGHRAALRPGGVDPSRDWSSQLPTRPYREM